MKTNKLGRTGMAVTEVCLGALPMGPLQKNLSVAECADIIVAGLEGGINFVDTAQMYKTYEPIKLAMQRTGKRPILASKSMASGFDQMQLAIDEALNALEVDYIDIFHLHAARAGADIFEQRKGAWECLLENKAQGLIRAVGVSTHSVTATELAASKPDLDVIFPLLNMKGIGILDGDRAGMEAAIAKCAAVNKGIYIMKALAGGELVPQYPKAMEYVRSIPGYAAIAVGMVSLAEVEYNLAYFNGAAVGSLPPIPTVAKRFIVLDFLCQGCMACAETCPNHAITTVDNKAVIQTDVCLTCGYCVGSCPQFAIRLV